MSAFKTIRVQCQDNSAEIVLQNPPSNIIDFEMMAELASALHAVQGSAVLKLSSALPNFSNGVDIKIHTPEHVEQMLHDFHALCRQLYAFDGITIAKLNGHALGGGMELALLCDFIFATSDTRLGFPEITLACFPPVAAVLLPHLIGKAAHRLLYTGEIIDVSEAKRLGMIDNENLLGKLESFSSNALRALKKTLRTTTGFDFDRELKRAEQIYISQIKNHPDTVEAIRAFLEKRNPNL
jgi:cyclohexa-1,5-dienecarbonyl-CoA hydratase